METARFFRNGGTLSHTYTASQLRRFDLNLHRRENLKFRTCVNQLYS